MKLAVIGAGQRGMVYAEYAYFKKSVEIAAIVEPDEEKRNIAAKMFGVEDKYVFSCAEDFFAKGKLCDALVIASMDKDHYGQCMKALECGYDILLEKPISPDPKECLRISKKAKESGRKVIVCHVLRYTTFFSAIKEIIERGDLGRIVAIQHNENVGNFHIAHAFVRGNWRNSDQTSPIIMQKSCHDMDILTWLADSEAKKIASFGSLTHFKEENAPEGSADRCLECKIADKCHYDARKAYLPIRGEWPAVVLGSDQSEEGIRQAIQTGPYGRCVYRCDNNVCDNQVTIIEFKNGVHASFVLSGFTNRVCRTLKIMCEYGEIRAEDDGNTIEVTGFASNAAMKMEKKIICPARAEGGHGGGDALLTEDFIANLEADGDAESKTAIERSVESHLMAYAAELSRVNGQVVDMDELKESLSCDMR